MNKLPLSLSLITCGFFVFGACQSGPDTSSSTNWFICETITDCAGVPGATACTEGYCVDDQGMRIKKGTAGAGGGSGGNDPSSGGASTGGASQSGGTGPGTGGGPTGGSSGSGSGGMDALGGAGGAAGSTGQTPTCEDYSSLQRCVTDDDCTTALKQTDCCGGMAATGINVASMADYTSLEVECSAAFPACGCATNGFVQADDGRWFRPDSDEVGASCPSGLCRSHVETRACGDALTCGPGELCLVFDTVTGPTQTVEFRCVANPCGDAAPDCSCAESLCDIGDGHSRLCFPGTNSVEEVRCQDQAQ